MTDLWVGTTAPISQTRKIGPKTSKAKDIILPKVTQPRVTQPVRDLNSSLSSFRTVLLTYLADQNLSHGLRPQPSGTNPEP